MFRASTSASMLDSLLLTLRDEKRTAADMAAAATASRQTANAKVAGGLKDAIAIAAGTNSRVVLRVCLFLLWFPSNHRMIRTMRIRVSIREFR